MHENQKREKRLEWICRILITIDMFLALAGYISYLQTKYQLISPLIPRSSLYEITDASMKASLVSGGTLLAGLCLYSFKKKIPAIILFGITAVFYEVSILLF